ncbi:MAG TPA: hypothetical protein VFY85_12445, partial [Gemmatimonadaceae bacterium]|nr:hypothetical protein [Gemmatimonadaceae bacterium]
MIPRLLRRQEAGIHLLLHVRVVLRELAEPAVAQQVDARVADLADQVPLLVDDQDRRGRPHPLLVRLRE